MTDGNTAAAEGTNWLCSRERNTVRTEVLAAAQEMLEHDGPEAVTLGAMARRTKIPRATIYSLFTSRKELLKVLTPAAPAAVIEQPAPEPAATEPECAAPVAEPESAAPVVTEPEIAAPVEQAPPEAVEAVAAEPSVGEPIEPAVADAAPVSEITPTPEEPKPAGTVNTGDAYDELMREQAEALQELSKQVIVAKPRQRDATEAALSRLDARVTVTEQSLSALEQRLGERLKALSTETSSLSGTLAGLKMRIHKFEERQQAALSQLRLEVLRLSKGEALGAPEAVPIAMEPLFAAEEPQEDSEADAAAASDGETPEDTPDLPKLPAYLTSARLAAIHAAARAATMPPPPPRPVRSIARRFVRRNRWLLVAVAAVLVVWFDVYVFAHYQAADAAAPDPQQQVVLHPRPANGPIAWSPRAQLVRGLKYLNGTGVQVDVDKAHLWLERAALRGNAVAQNLMGVLYQTGTGVRADTPAAIRWYEAAAMQGNLQAMTNLGKVYAGGWKEGTDYVKAAVWFAKAAQYGEVDAQFDLAVLYELGQGVSRDRLEAYKWYMIAGKNGDSHAATRAAALASELEPEELQAADAAVTGYAPIAVDRAANDVPVVSG